jgi:predicted nucleic acid-binding protein
LVSSSIVKISLKYLLLICIAAATASHYNGILVTGDKEFSQLEKNITIEWL